MLTNSAGLNVFCEHRSWACQSCPKTHYGSTAVAHLPAAGYAACANVCCAVRRYVRYMGNIRLIQEYLVRKADKYCVPRVDNSNVDRSVGIIHLTVMR